MPIYEFKCKDCDIVFEELRKMGDSSTAVCPECNSEKAEKVFSVFTGTGIGGSCDTCAPSPGG